MGLPSQTQPTLGSRQILTAVALFVESFGPNWMSEWKLNMAPMLRQIWAATWWVASDLCPTRNQKVLNLSPTYVRLRLDG